MFDRKTNSALHVQIQTLVSYLFTLCNRSLQVEKKKSQVIWRLPEIGILEYV